MNCRKMSDQELLGAFGSDPEVGTEIYNRFYPVVKKTCSRYLYRHGDSNVHEVVQIIFIHLLVNKKLAKFRGDASLENWLQVVSRNACFGWLRETRRRYGCCQEIKPEDDAWAIRHEDPLRPLVREEEYTQLMHALAAMPRKLQDALWLRYYQGKSYKEASRMLGMSVSYYGVCVKRALARVKNVVREAS